ncbi:MAG: formylmethanofuran dehydrogenase subunit E family protein [Candidatus Omnitrophica bacterium]|nr:formylmethanofuran dehydrogenase subunit E family protein [Candidatus Omnitrophota bacterium]
MTKVSLRQAIGFHGHLGPWLVLGLLIGELSLKKLGAKKYFGLKVVVRGANKKPRSCLIDGLQLSTGATYGKANIRKGEGKTIMVVAENKENKKRISVCLKKGLTRRLAALKGHSDSEAFARQLYKAKAENIFDLSTEN